MGSVNGGKWSLQKKRLAPELFAFYNEWQRGWMLAHGCLQLLCIKGFITTATQAKYDYKWIFDCGIYIEKVKKGVLSAKL